MSRYASPDGGATLLVVKDGLASLRVRNGEVINLDTATAARSQLVKGVIQESDVGGEASIPLSQDAMLLWARANDSSTGEEGCIEMDKEDVGRLCKLIVAADVLIDEGMKATASKQLAAVLHQPSSAAFPDACQAARTLPDHLLHAVLSHVPLRHSLLNLPFSLHAATITTHNPSIDSGRSLHLPPLPLSLLTPALYGTATLPRLEALSLAGATLPTDAAPFLPPILRSLPALTSLDISDAFMDSAAATALAEALPALPQLRALDLSESRISLEQAQALLHALARCTMLRVLRLLHTAPAAAAAALADCLPSLPGLTELAFGDVVAQQGGGMMSEDSRSKSDGGGSSDGEDSDDTDGRKHAAEQAAARAGLLDLLRAAEGVANLRTLTLHVVHYSTDDPHPLVTALGRLTQVHSMHADLRYLPDLLGWPQAMPPLTQLTSLHLGGRSVWTRGRGMCSEVPHISSMHALRELLFSPDVDEVDALAEALPCLQALSRLQLDCSRGSAALWDMGALAAATAAAASLPQMRELHMPVVGYRENSEALVETLCAATHLHLSLGMYVYDPPSSHDPSANPLTLCVPLFPCMCSMQLSTAADWAWLSPLTIEAPQLSRLTALSIHGSQPSVEGEEAALRVFSSLQHMHELKRLTLFVNCDFFGRIVVFSEAALSAACQALPHLKKLVSVELDLPFAPMAQSRLLPAIAPLTGLQRLHLGLHVAADAHLQPCIDALALLPLRSLQVVIEQEQDVVALRQLLAQLPHLREVEISARELYMEIPCRRANRLVRGILRQAATSRTRYGVEFWPSLLELRELTEAW